MTFWLLDALAAKEFKYFSFNNSLVTVADFFIFSFFVFVVAIFLVTFNFFKALPDFIAIFRYMKKNEDRFGMNIKIADLVKVAKA